MNFCRELEREKVYSDLERIFYRWIDSIKNCYYPELIKAFRKEYSLENIKSQLEKENNKRYLGSFSEKNLMEF